MNRGRIRLPSSSSSESPLRLRRLASQLASARSAKALGKALGGRVRLGQGLPLRVRPAFIVLTALSLFLLGALGFHPTLAKKISPDAIPFSDKILHFFCFGFASAEFYAIWSVDEAARALHWRYFPEGLSVIVCGLIGSIGSEFVQGLLPYKTFQWGDVFANIFGTALGISIARTWTRALAREREVRRLYQPVNLATVDELSDSDNSDAEDREMEEGGARTPDEATTPASAKMFDDGSGGGLRKMARIEANVWDESDEIFGLGDDEDDVPSGTTEYASKLKEAQSLGARAAQLEHSGSFDDAFASYLKAAQSFLFLIRHTHEPVAKARLRETSKSWVERAERIKKAKKDGIAPVRRDRASVEEQDAVVERAGVVGQQRYPRWSDADRIPNSSAVGPQPALSPGQLLAGATYQRAPTVPMISQDFAGTSIVQDNVDDCSLVAALIVGADHHRKFGSKYMKVMGGYDFRGSNSSIDLYPSYSSDLTWKRLLDGFRTGRCVVTVGTAKDDSQALLENGLVPGHNYAISEPIRIAWDVISVFFESLYVNWDPNTFLHQDTFHCSIKKRNAEAPGQSTVLRIQLDPASASASEICVLLSRHQQKTSDTGEFVGLSVGIGSTKASSRMNRLAVDGGTTLMDSPHIFYRFKTEPQHTLYEVSGKWLERSAGGNHSTATFMNNPQYRIVLSPVPGKPNLLGQLNATCESSQDLPVNVKLIRARGERVTDFEERDVLAGTAKYSYGLDMVHCDGLRVDSYTLVVSTFRPGDEGSFEVVVGSNLPIKITPIAPEGGGMFNRTAKGSWAPGLDGGSRDIMMNPLFLVGQVSKPVNLR
ncbi:hypothetical protein RQP46_005969 [Phenoliferia psychrophenolica]